jgi:hypothetical protein
VPDVPPNSYAARTTEQLAALDEAMQCQIQSLSKQRELIQAEMRARLGQPMLEISDAVPTSGGIRLNYLTPAVKLAREPGIGDPYADEARRYGLRATMILGAMLAAATILGCVLANY